MANLSPFPKFRAFDNLGKPLVGGKLHTYVAGTTTPKVSFQDSTGAVANTNPVVLDARGEADVWLDGSYSMLLQNANGITQWTVDNVTGVGSGEGSTVPVNASEWLDQADAPTFISATQYSVPGDRTAVYHVGRRQRAQVSGGIAYSTITVSVFSAGTTTITVQNDGLVLDGGLSALAVGINSADNPSISVDCVEGIGTLNTVPTGALFMWGTGTAPTGYLFCDGSEVSRTTEAALFAVLGTTFGVGDGSTTFNLPDFRGRGPLGFGQSPDSAEGGGQGTARSLAEKIGTETHTLTQPELPTNNQSIRDPTAEDSNASGGNFTAANVNLTRNFGGSDQPHNNMQPSLVVGFIIKT